MNETGSTGSLLEVPLFPLPNVVLFPRAVLPLHIFEQRYRTMTADALAGDKRIAMALLRPGWEKCYYKRPQIEPVVCVGSIVSYELLPDGKYNFVLQGMLRATVVSEVGGGAGDVAPYRIGKLRALTDQPVEECAFDVHRKMLLSWFSSGVLAQTRLAPQIRALLAGSAAMAQLVDLLAFGYVEDIAIKQRLLAETCVRTRVDQTIAALDRLRQRRTTPIPPGGPSMN